MKQNVYENTNANLYVFRIFANMSCLCDPTKPIPQCVDNITIGTITDHETDVIVQFKDIITGRVQSVEATSDEDGLITADVTDIQEFFSPNFIYELRIFLTDNTQVEITIDTETKGCLQVQFETGTIETAVLELA